MTLKERTEQLKANHWTVVYAYGLWIVHCDLDCFVAAGWSETNAWHEAILTDAAKKIFEREDTQP